MSNTHCQTFEGKVVVAPMIQKGGKGTGMYANLQYAPGGAARYLKPARRQVDTLLPRIASCKKLSIAPKKVLQRKQYQKRLSLLVSPCKWPFLLQREIACDSCCNAKSIRDLARTHVGQYHDRHDFQNLAKDMLQRKVQGLCAGF